MRNALNEIRREETHMRSSARYRHSLKLLTFLWTTTLQRCKLIYAFGGGLGRLRQQAAYAIPISFRTMSFPADLIGGNLRLPPLPKTRRIIALPPPKCNRKKNSVSGAEEWRIPAGENSRTLLLLNSASRKKRSLFDRLYNLIERLCVLL